MNVDYVFFVKAKSSENDAKIYFDNINLKYNNGVVSDKAWGVAVFKESVDAGESGSTVESMSLVSILKLNGASYFNSTNAVKTATTKDSVINLSERAVIDDDIDSTHTVYYKIAVRLWLEGEDLTCNNETYALLTNAWTLDLSIRLDTRDTDTYAANELQSA